MPAPYPVELRERAVAASHAMGLARAAAVFQVGVASLKRWRQLERERGSLAARPMGGDRRAGGKTAAKLEEAVNEKPDRILRELAGWFVEHGGRALSPSGISRALRRAGYRRRKKSILATERQDPRVIALRRGYLAAVEGVDPARLVFLDESGCQLGMQRRTAWRRPGTTVVGRAVRNRGTVTTVLGAVSQRGLIAAMYGEGATTTAVFLAFLREALVPELRPGDVVVMDDLGAHKPAVVRAVVEAAGASVILSHPIDFPPRRLATAAHPAAR